MAIERPNSVHMPFRGLRHFSILFALFWSACTYQYVTPLPAVPQFESAGELQTQLALACNHVEAQVSFSPLNHFGLTYNGFRAIDSGSRMDGVTLHYYSKLKRTNFYWTGSYGFDVANLNSDNSSVLFSEYGSSFYSSRYAVHRLGLGTWYQKQNGYLQYSFDLHYHHIQFFRLRELSTYREFGTVVAIRYDLVRPSTYRVVSPLITLTINTPKRHLYYRQSLGCTIPLDEPMDMTRVWSSSRGPTSKTLVQGRPLMSHLILSGTIGLRVNAFRLFSR